MSDPAAPTAGGAAAPRDGVTAAARHVRRQWLRLAHLASGAPVPSPCNSVCRIDPDSGLCTGCLRTLDEIGAWGTLGEDRKRAVWRELRARADVTRPAGAASTPIHPAGDGVPPPTARDPEQRP
jgi:predicted Fe-S protein YdhL (DUF1289 family)